MNSKSFPTLLALLLVTGCATEKPGAPAGPSADVPFSRLAEEFIEGYLAWRPQMGTGLGLHQYDGRITDLSKASIESEITRLQSAQRRLKRIRPKLLSAQAAYDYRILQAAIDRELFGFEDLRSPWRNPMPYAGALDVNIYIKRDFAPLADRVRSITSILRQASNVMAAAKANLEPSLPRPYIETAIEIAQGSARFLEKDLMLALLNFKEEPLRSEFENANRAAVRELNGFAEYLREEKLPRANNRFALGTRRYRRMLAGGELITLSPDNILELGLKELRREQQVFAEAARRIAPDKPPMEVFRQIQKDHPTAENLIPEARRTLEDIRQFVIEHDIVSMPSEVRVRVEETPPFARSTSFASMDTPGAFERKATEAYYYITPAEADWTEKHQEEWLTAFNYYTTDIVSIHEAYPGHYTQFLHLNASPATKLEKVFGSYAFVEGWAHYTEQMMLDEGFAGGESATNQLRAAKYRLAQSDEALLRLCRLCVSVQMHCRGMSVEQGTRFFQDNCYYEEKPARQEALRGTYDPEYLYYTLGKLQILKLREDYKRQEGGAYSLRQFHDELLRHGMPPLRLLREVLLRDPAQWEQVFPD